MSNGDVLNQQTQLKIAPKNHHKTIIFSSCDIGANATMCQHFRVQFHAESIIGYRTGIDDAYCFLAEPALLQLIRDGKKPWDATEIVKRALDPWKGLNQRNAKTFPIECHRRVS